MNETINIIYKELKILYSRSWKTSSYQYARPFVRLEDYNDLKERYDKLRDNINEGVSR